MTQNTDIETSQTAEMKIRLPVELRRQIEGAAEENHRKMNAEIIARLERTFAEDAERSSGGTTFVAKAKANSMASFEDRLAKLESKVKELEGKK